MDMFNRKNNCFWNVLLMVLLFPVMGCMAVPGGGGGGTSDDGVGDGPEDGLESGGEDDKKDDGDDDKKGADDDKKDSYVSRDEMNKVIAQRDKLKGERRELNAKLKEMEDKIKTGIVDPQEIEKLKEKSARLQALEDELEDKKRKEMSENERLKHDNEKLKGKLGDLQEQMEASKSELQKSLQEQIDALESEVGTLRGFKLESEITAVAAEIGAVSPQQIVRLTKGDFKLNEDGEFVVEAPGKRGGISEISVSDHIKSFLGDETNANLISAKSPRKAPDAGDGGGKAKSSGKVTLTATQKRDASMRGMTDDEYYAAVVEPREKRLGEIESGRKGQQKSNNGGSGKLPGQVDI